MNVLITTQVYPPEIHPTAVMAEELAIDLAREGWRVTVACGLPHHPTGKLPDDFERRVKYSYSGGAGITVRRLWHPTTSIRHIAARMFIMSSQMIASVLAASTSGRPDIVLSFGGPPLIGPVLSGALAHSWRIPTLTVLHDIYPDVARDTASVRNPLILAVARRLELAQYAMSDHLVVLGPKSRQLLLERGVADSKISVIPVWLDPAEITPRERDTRWRRELGIDPERFVILYAGTVGIISGAEILADVARKLPSNALIVVVGGGKAWTYLEQQVRSDAVLARQLKVVPYQARSRIAEVQASANLSIVTLARGQGLTSVPSKVQGYMAAGRPVLASVDKGSDTAELIERGQFGIVTRPEDVDAIVGAIEFAMHHPAWLEERGTNARRIFEVEFSRDTQTRRFGTLLNRMVGIGAARKSEQG